MLAVWICAASAAAETDLFVAGENDVWRIDLATGESRVIWSLPRGEYPSSSLGPLDIDAERNLWVAILDAPSVLARIDPFGATTAVNYPGWVQDLAAHASGQLLVLDRDLGLVRFDPATQAATTVLPRAGIGGGEARLAVWGDTAFITAPAAPGGPGVLEIDLSSGEARLVASGGLLHTLRGIAVSTLGEPLVWSRQGAKLPVIVRIERTSGVQSALALSRQLASAGEVAVSGGELFAFGPGKLVKVDLATTLLTTNALDTGDAHRIAAGAPLTDPTLLACRDQLRTERAFVRECSTDLQQSLADLGVRSTLDYWDSDDDGETDWTDRCPATARRVDTDSAGCSLDQSCAAVEDPAICDRIDWRNDEPAARRPGDCVFVEGQGCVPAVRCGQVITRSVTLEQGLDCDGDGLIVGARGITLDLGGHTVRLVGNGDGVAIRNDGFDRVKVRNGTVGGLGGIVIRGADDNHVEDLEFQTAEGGGFALLVEDSRGTRVERTSGRGEIRLVRSTGAIVTHNVMRASQYGDRPIVLESSHRNAVTYNDMYGNGSVTFLQSNENRFIGNKLRTDEYRNALVLRDSHENVIEENAIYNPDLEALLVIDSHRNVIRRNQISSDGRTYWKPTAVISIERSDHTRFEENGILSMNSGLFVLSGSDHRIRWNEVLQPKPWCPVEDCEDGIRVYAESGPARVEGNVVRGFTDDGLDIETPHVTLRGNRVEASGDLGIEAVEGVRDRGGNVASGSGNPTQCLNVACAAP